MNQLQVFAVIVCFILSIGISCQVTPTEKPGNTVPISSSDALMNTAIQQAQDTLPLFIKALQNPKPCQTDFSIKVRFPYEGGNYEHMWVDHLTFSDNRFAGILANIPEEVENLRLGDPVSVDMKDISDWTIIDDNHLLGGFTIYAIRSGLTDSERKQFDAGFKYILSDLPALP